MTDYATAEADYLAALSQRGGARAPATLGEIWNSEFTRSALDTVGGVNEPLGNAFGDLETAIERHAGKPLGDYANERGVRLDQAVTPDLRIKALGQLADTFDVPTQETLKPLRDVRLNAAKKAQAIEKDAAEVASATYGLSGDATAFVAGVARQTLDPINLTAMAVTAPLGGSGSILARIGTEAAVNAGTQALVEPYVQQIRAELGLDAGFGRAAQNVFEAGIGGAAFSSLLHGAGYVLGRIGGRAGTGASPVEAAPARAPEARLPDLSPVDSAIVMAGRSSDRLAEDVVYIPDHARPLGPDDMAAAARLAERDEVMAALSDAADADGGVAHRAGMDDAARAMEDGQPVNGTSASVPFLITRQMKEELRARGLDDAAIRELTPQQAHDILFEPLPSDLSAAAPPRGPRGRAAADPQTWSLFEYLASRGGIARDAGGDVDAIFGGTRGPFLPGFGPLLRKGGMTLDQAVTAAKEGGYFIDPADTGDGVRTFTIRNLLDAIDEESRGRKQFRLNYAPDTSPVTPRDVARTTRELRRELKRAGYDDAGLDEQLAARAAELVQRGEETDVLLAFERAIMEGGEAREAIAEARRADAELSKIPGWDPDDGAATSQDGGADARAGRQAGSDAGGSRAPGEGPRTGGGDDRGAGSGSPGGGVTPEQLARDALRADVQRTLTELGDVEVVLANPDGTTRTVKASDALLELDADAKAQAELDACIKGGGDEPPF